MSSVTTQPSSHVSRSPGHETTRTSRTNRIVCTACRQSKVRCVLTDDQNCARCVRLGLDCHRDTNFKRVSKSRKIAELEKQVQILTTAFNGSPKPPQAPATQQYHAASPSFVAPSPQPPPFHSNGSPNPPLNVANQISSQYSPSPNDGSLSIMSIFHTVGEVLQPAPPSQPGPRGATSARSIHSAYITGKSIDELFEIFFKHYHPALPFLNSSKSPDEYYDSGSILFWLIISIASRRYSNDILLFPMLCEWIPKLLWECISTPPYTVPMIQAIILACAWPFPTTSMWNDTITTLSSIAISISMQLGLHRPLNATDFLRQKATVDENDYQMRAFTWAAANIVSQTIEATYGVLPTTPFDRTTEASCKPGNIYTLPNILRFKLVTFRYCNKISRLVSRDLTENGDPFSSNRTPANPTLSWVTELQDFETRMHTWKQKHRDEFSFHDQIYIAAAAVYTNSMYFFDSTSTPTRKTNILKAYSAAAEYINQILAFDRSHDYILHAPNYAMKMLTLSACLIMKVLRSSYATEVDFDEGKRLCNQACISALRSSVDPQDSPAKFAKMTAQVWHSNDRSVLSEPPVLMVKSRLGASILFDYIWTWRQEFGGQPEAYPRSRSNAGMSPPIGSNVMLPTEGVFDDASMVDLDFLNDPDWMESITNSIGVS